MMAATQPVRFPLVEPLESRDATTNFDAKVVNGIIEQSTRGTLRVVKRPGQQVAFIGVVGKGQGIDNYLNQLYSISGDFLNVFGASATFTAFQSTPSAGFSPRTGHFVAGFNGALWVMGGFNSSGTPLNDVWKSVDGVNWMQVLANAPWAARGAGNAIVFNGKMFIMGGSASSVGLGATYGDVWSTVDGFTWIQTNASAFPGRRRFGLTSNGTTLFVAGGAGAAIGSALFQTYYSDVYSSLDGTNWTKLASTSPWVARANFGFFFLGGRLRVVGGLLTDPFVNATSDLWSSADGIVWTRDSTNPFNVTASGVWPIAAFNSYGTSFPLPSAVTVTGGSGGAAAWAFTDFDDDEDDDFQSGNYASIFFNNVGSGMTSAPTLSFGTNVGFNAQAYAFLDGTSNAGAKQFRTAMVGGTVYLLEFAASGTFVERIWSTTDGTTFTNTNTAFPTGWSVRNIEFFAQGNLWAIGGVNGTPTFFNDVWFIAIQGAGTPLNPNVPLGFYHFNQTATSIATPLLVFKSTKDLYSYNASLATLTKLSNVANYPATTVPGLVYLDGVFYVMDPQGRIWGSAPNDPGTWTALNVVAMQNEPNGGVAIAKLQNYVVAFGVWTIEFFYDNANPSPASALSPNTTLPIQIGCANGESVIEMQATVVWIGQTRREGQGVYLFNGYVPQRISTAFVDRILQNDPLTDVSAVTVDSFGHSLYILTLRTSNITLVYSFESQLWTIWSSLTPNAGLVVNSLTSDAYGTVTANVTAHNYAEGDPVLIQNASIVGYNGTFNIAVVDANNFTYMVPGPLASNPGVAQSFNYTANAFRPVASAQVFDVDYMQDLNNGIIYSQDIVDVTDAGLPVDLTIITDRYDGGTTVWKVCRRITLACDIEASNVIIQYTDNDYQTYSSARYMSVSTGQRATVTPAGRFRRRAFKIRHTLPTTFRAEALELDLILGSF